ncbi:hypothetical protein K6119_09805 [Paracrocinitomix mangrovi]|uniref:hypothetical protein n=1 Tax=Paracrocinitomix mangrovi TaxID=2862509 RepID=UPI001C8E4862|nr:hypothetical protein [Paracrocinitomix mangrovi]UKN03784.1 hypothetical protein K6119_09805 [Paracrocinitomix mangrovi]
MNQNLMKETLIKSPYLAILFLTLVSCSTEPDTPEEVVKEFTEAIANCEQDKVLELSTGDFAVFYKETNEYNPCTKYNTQVKCVQCEIEGNSAICKSIEERSFYGVKYGQMEFCYDMLWTDGSWKVSNTRECLFIEFDECKLEID